MEKTVCVDIILKDRETKRAVGKINLIEESGQVSFSKVREALDVNMMNWNSERKAFNFEVNDEIVLENLEKVKRLYFYFILYITTSH